MQTVLDDYLIGYNTRRPHQGRGMNGKRAAASQLPALYNPTPHQETVFSIDTYTILIQTFVSSVICLAAGH
jgi:hypothetical protein